MCAPRGIQNQNCTLCEFDFSQARKISKSEIGSGRGETQIEAVEKSRQGSEKNELFLPQIVLKVRTFALISLIISMKLRAT